MHILNRPVIEKYVTMEEEAQIVPYFLFYSFVVAFCIDKSLSACNHLFHAVQCSKRLRGMHVCVCAYVKKERTRVANISAAAAAAIHM